MACIRSWPVSTFEQRHAHAGNHTPENRTNRQKKVSLVRLTLHLSVRKLLLMPESRTEVATPMFGYRVTFAMVAVFRHGSHELIRPLARGLILIPTSSVNSDGTIEATCGEHRVRVFQRDLMDRTERIDLSQTAVRSEDFYA
jgi:hypothetical protein